MSPVRQLGSLPQRLRLTSWWAFTEPVEYEQERRRAPETESLGSTVCTTSSQNPSKFDMKQRDASAAASRGTNWSRPLPRGSRHVLSSPPPLRWIALYRWSPAERNLSASLASLPPVHVREDGSIPGCSQLGVLEGSDFGKEPRHERPALLLHLRFQKCSVDFSDGLSYHGILVRVRAL
jgi:hypothetical protein